MKSSPKERFILAVSEKLVNEGVRSEVAYNIAISVASEYIGQEVQPLIDYYKQKHINQK